MGPLGKLWRGEHSLAVSFWLFGAIGIPLGILLSTLLLVGIYSYNAISLLLFIAPVLFLVNAAYLVVVGTGIWRSSAGHRKASHWSILARGVVIVVAVLVTTTLTLTARMLIPDGSGLETSDRTRAGTREIESDDRGLAKELLTAPRRTGFWDIEYDEQTGDWQPKLVLEVAKDKSSAKALEQEINSRYPIPQFPGIEIVRIEGKAAYVRILNGDLYTEGMGTTGAEVYSAMVTYTLTSLENISTVCLVGFEEGNHAAPGCRSREHFFPFLGLAKQNP